MRPVVKHPVGFRSLFAEGSFRDRLFASSAVRIALGLVAAALGVLLLSSWTRWPNPLQLLAAATSLVLAYAPADNALPKRSGQRPPKMLPEKTEPESDLADSPQLPILACPAGRSECWVLDTIQGLLTTAQEAAHGLEVSQAANALARRACELVDANAAWVYRMEENGERTVLVSSHLHPRAAHDWDGLSAAAHQVAGEGARSYGRRGIREARHPRVSTVGDYLAVPLVRRNRALGMLVVHCAGTHGMPSRFKGDLLSALANQATLALENSLLYESQLDAEAKLRQFGLHRADYAATLSHELRTPLTSIKGFAQLLTRDQDASIETVRQYASTIASEADKLALIVSDIVDLTRMETGLLQMHRKPVALGRLIRDVVGRVQPMSPTQQLQSSLPERLPSVRVDPERLEQVLGRLLVDAIGQSTPDSTVLVAAEAGEEGVTVRLEYRTSEAQVDSLIKALKGPGQFADDGQATQLGRGGLGLYICRNFIEAHGGKMWIEQPEEQVARVVFTLPY